MPNQREKNPANYILNFDVSIREDLLIIRANTCLIFFFFGNPNTLSNIVPGGLGGVEFGLGGSPPL